MIFWWGKTLMSISPIKWQHWIPACTSSLARIQKACSAQQYCFLAKEDRFFCSQLQSRMCIVWHFRGSFSPQEQLLRGCSRISAGGKPLPRVHVHGSFYVAMWLPNAGTLVLRNKYRICQFGILRLKHKMCSAESDQWDLWSCILLYTVGNLVPCVVPSRT